MNDLSGPNRRAVLAGAAMAPLAAQAQSSDAPGSPVSKPPSMTLAFEAIVDIAPTIDEGPGPLGHRRMVPILGGSFAGPRIKGTVMPGGADRQLIRPDGIKMLNALYELKTDDGAIITVLNKVLIDDRSAGPRYAFSNIEITAPAGPHGWLNERVFVGTLGSLRPARSAVRVTVWALA